MTGFSRFELVVPRFSGFRRVDWGISRGEPPEGGHYEPRSLRTPPGGVVMYAYRRMTPEQQRAVVADRMARGVPWHKPAHPKSPEGWYLITGACYEHRLHFRRPSELTALQRRLWEAFGEAGTDCAAWAMMPNHYHALLRIDDFETFGKAVGKVHGRSSHYANRRDGTPGRQVWYKYADRAIRSERHYWTTVHYIVWNPVKHGFATCMREWPWSSYLAVATEHGESWIEDLRREYPLREYGAKWDTFVVTGLSRFERSMDG